MTSDTPGYYPVPRPFPINWDEMEVGRWYRIEMQAKGDPLVVTTNAYLSAVGEAPREGELEARTVTFELLNNRFDQEMTKRYYLKDWVEADRDRYRGSDYTEGAEFA